MTRKHQPFTQLYVPDTHRKSHIVRPMHKMAIRYLALGTACDIKGRLA